MLRRVAAVGLVLAAALCAPAAAGPVEWDRWSLQVGGARTFVNAGEVHPFRMPSPRQWPGVLARMRAAGLDTISIYVPWSVHEPAPGRFRFGGRFDLDRFLAAARDAGLRVIVRPGPYVQAEIEGGGFPSWLLGSPGVLRTVDPAYTAAWKRWFAEVMPRIARWQLGGQQRGTVIAVQVENEFPGDSDQGRAYIRDLVATAKSHGIVVPITHNDVQFLGSGLSRGLFVDLVDVFGFDNYPYGFRCCPEWNESTFAQVDRFEEHYRERGVTRSPLYAAEIQGGQTTLGADDGRTLEERYRNLLGYETVQSVSLLAEGLTMVARYMTYGGTSWGYLPIVGHGSSYDYAAPIREWEGLGPRYDELRRIGLQIRAAGDTIAATEAVAGRVESSDPDVLLGVRQRVGGEALHVFLRNADPGPPKRTQLTIDGRRTPEIVLRGHDARWLLANATLAGWRIEHTTAEVAWADRRTLVLFGDPGARLEALVEGRRLGLAPSRRPQVMRFSGGRRVVLLSRALAARLWRRGGDLVIGPDLVSADAIEVTRRRRVTVIGRRVRKLTLPAPPRSVALPELRRWRAARDGAERDPGYDDSGWRVADRATTHNQMQPNTSPVLGADDYGIPGVGFVWYRGRFGGRAEGLCIEGRHRFHVWLNGRSLGSVETLGETDIGFGTGIGASPPASEPATLAFPPDAVSDGENVIAVLVESWGHAMDAGAANQAKQVRGLVSASLERPGSPRCGFTLGGETTPPLGGGPPVGGPATPKPSGGIDWRLRGGDPLAYPNASGLGGELAGWHLASHDDSRWTPVELPHESGAGPGEVTWYRTEFDLRLPRDVRAALALELDRGSHPAEIYLNGVHVARAGRDRETRFQLPRGVVRTRGRNVLAIARWHVAGGRRMARPRLVAQEIVRTRPARAPLFAGRRARGRGPQAVAPVPARGARGGRPGAGAW